MPKTHQHLRYRNDKIEEITALLPVETPVSLTVNGKFWLNFMCTPLQLEALAVGFLFNEGIIKDFSEVADVRVCRNGENVDIWLNHVAEKPEKWTRTSGCTGGMTSIDTRADASTRLSTGFEPARHQNGTMLDPKQIPVLLKMLDENQTLYRETGGVHTSLLTDGKKSLVSAEDIGRHNTLDKIAGMMLMNGIKPKTRILLTTGRVSSEMMQKAARIGASVVISRTSPSSLAVEIAEDEGITLIGYAKRHRFNVYTHKERIA